MVRIDEKLKKTIKEEIQIKESHDAGTLADLNIDKSDFTDKAFPLSADTFTLTDISLVSETVVVAVFVSLPV